jgi:hypothetical protein
MKTDSFAPENWRVVTMANFFEPTPVPMALKSISWKMSKAFTKVVAKETQFQYYTRMGAAPEVLSLVQLDSKPFGSATEAIICELFAMQKRTSSENDGVFKGHKVEIKTARYWAGSNDCRWQHLEPEHDYRVALLVLLDFDGFKVWAVDKKRLMGEMRDAKIVEKQGKQGFWLTKSAAEAHLTPIQSVRELEVFVASLE